MTPGINMLMLVAMEGKPAAQGVLQPGYRFMMWGYGLGGQPAYVSAAVGGQRVQISETLI